MRRESTGAMRHSTRIPLRGYACAAATILVVLAYAPEGWSRAPKSAGCQQMTEAQAKVLFDEWNKALQQNPEKIVQTYTLNAVLLPTFENGPLIGRNEIRGYFDHFLEKHPVGRIDTRAIIPAGCNMGVVAGLYTFTVDKDKVRVDEPARYTFVYVYKPEGARGRWLIAHHHSSAQPQKGAAQ
jgi:uncharacterized protein (TIGR02246 family)